jgi:uncharacterized repeat protein (TIGR04138 family)
VVQIQDRQFAKLLEQDKRFKREAYDFVFESLDYAQNRLHLGQECLNEPTSDLEGFDIDEEENLHFQDDEGSIGKHITGQDLSEAARMYATEMYGFMAKVVLNNFGIHSTGDFGEIVYNLIKIGRMRKTAQDCREDFDDVYDFETAFDSDYIITPRKK